jgi:uncharacterized membrane protein YhiD involved in acid resistance
MYQEIKDKLSITKIKIAIFGLAVHLIFFWYIGLDINLVSIILYLFIACAIVMYILAKLEDNDIISLEEIRIKMKEQMEEARIEMKEQMEEAKQEANKLKIDNISNPNLKQQVEEREIEGWSITDIDNSKSRVTMEGTKGGTIGGHAVTGVLTGFWTLGVGNIAYSQLSKKRNKEQIVVSVDENKDVNNSEKDVYELLEQIKRLRDSGAITAEEYDDKKEDILDRI